MIKSVDFVNIRDMKKSLMW